MKKINFYAGPAILSPEVLSQAADAVRDFDGMGLSLIEISHRSKQFVKVMDDARALALELYGLGEDYDALFLQGGASLQFLMIPYNYMDSEKGACYINTGEWAGKAIKEAKFFGNAEVIASSEDKNFSYIPKDFRVNEDASYLHITSNNTIYGTQWDQYPKSNIPLIADMSSDIYCKEIDAKRFDLIYAGAQKNIGPAGTTLVLLKKDLAKQVNRKIPTMLNYKTHIDKESMFNTPPVFAVYVCYLSMKWLKANGGIAAMEKTNRQKANLLYSEIDRNSLFYGTTAKEDRSLMNVTFLAKDKETEERFLKYASEQNLMGIAGYRTVGGFRASIYNAMPLSGVQQLVDAMKEFERCHS